MGSRDSLHLRYRGVIPGDNGSVLAKCLVINTALDGCGRSFGLEYLVVGMLRCSEKVKSIRQESLRAQKEEMARKQKERVARELTNCRSLIGRRTTSCLLIRSVSDSSVLVNPLGLTYLIRKSRGNFSTFSPSLVFSLHCPQL